MTLLYFVSIWLAMIYVLLYFYLAYIKYLAYFSNNKSKFVSLRKILPILSFILLIATQSRGQSTRIPLGSVTTGRIIKMYPNPATAYITFDLQKGLEKGMSIQVYSFLGKKMHEIVNASQKSIINLSDFNRGLYMYHLLDGTGKVIESGKFQVTK